MVSLCPAAPLPSGPWSSLLKPWSRSRQRIPVVPSQQSNREEKGQSPGRSVPAHRAGGWEWPQNPAAPAWRRGTRSCTASWDEGAWCSGQQAWSILPHGLCGDTSSQGMLGFSSLGGRKIVHIIFCRLQAKSCSFYLQNPFQVIDLSKTTRMGKGNKALASWQLKSPRIYVACIPQICLQMLTHTPRFSLIKMLLVFWGFLEKYF